jgi:SAM-dependent methyltransferase
MSEYVFDQAWEGERARLANLERWLDPGTTRHMDEIGVGPGWKCLEVGGGAGSITRWLSARVGDAGRVVATDLDTRFLDAIGGSNLEVRKHDITADALPENEFDIAHSRLLLEHLPAREDVLKRMISALKPGGWLIIEDLDNVTHLAVTPNKTYERVSDAVFGIMTSVGYEPNLGRRLPQLLTEAGLEDVHGEGRIAIGTREGNPGIAMWRLSLTHLRAPAVEAGLASDADFDEVFELLDDASFAVMPPAVIAAWGRKPL